MKFTKTFEIKKDRLDRIPAFFAMQGYELEGSSSNSYKFKRGSRWATLYTWNVRRCPTTVDLSFIEIDAGNFQVLVNYNISGKGFQIFTSRDRKKIMAEIEDLEVFTEMK